MIIIGNNACRTDTTFWILIGLENIEGNKSEARIKNVSSEYGIENCMTMVLGAANLIVPLTYANLINFYASQIVFFLPVNFLLCCLFSFYSTFCRKIKSSGIFNDDISFSCCFFDA